MWLMAIQASHLPERSMRGPDILCENGWNFSIMAGVKSCGVDEKNPSCVFMTRLGDVCICLL